MGTSDREADELLVRYERLLATFPTLDQVTSGGLPLPDGSPWTSDDVQHAAELIVWDVVQERAKGQRTLAVLDAVQVGNLAAGDALDHYEPERDGPIREHLMRKVAKGLDAGPD